MTFFFFVLGLEARREFDLGDFREPPRFVLPSLASVVGMGAAAAIYLAFNLGSSAEGCYVWRHPPLADGHRHAELAALASEAAADHGAFPGMHDQLLEHQDKPRMADLVSHAERLGLDVARFTEQLQGHVGANRIAQDARART